MPEGTITAPPAASGAGEGAASVTETVATPTTAEETLSTTTETTETPVETTEQPTGEETPGTEQTAEDKEDARLLPKAIRSLKETDPKAYQAEKTRFYEHRSYKTTFPTVAEARRAKQTLDIVGGEEGVRQIQTDISDFKKVAQQYSAGDPAFIEDLAEMDSVAFGSHIKPMLDKYQKLDTEGFNREIASRISGEHQAWGLRSRLQAAYQAIKAGKTDDALNTLNEIAGWHDQIDKIAKAEEDPRYKKLKDQLKQVREGQQKEQGDAQHKDFDNRTRPVIFSKIEKIVESYTKGKNLDEDDIKLLRLNVLRFADDDIKKDKEALQKFLQDRDNIMARGDIDGASRFVLARWDQAIAEAAKRTMRTFSKGAAGAPAPKVEQTNGNGAPKSEPGYMKVNTRPNGSQIDTAKSPRWLIEKRAILRDGRKVSWAHL